MLAGRDDVAQLASGADGEVEFLAGLLRIVIDDLRDQAAHRAGRDHLEIGGAGGRRDQRRHCSDQKRKTTCHGPPYAAVFAVHGRAVGRADHACPASLESMPTSMPIFLSAFSYLASVSWPKMSSLSAAQCSQPFWWISLSSWPGAQ